MKYDLAIENNCAHLGQKLILSRYLLDAEIRLNFNNSASVHFNFKQKENTQAQKVWYFFPSKHVYFQINSVYFQNKQRKTLTLTHPIAWLLYFVLLINIGSIIYIYKYIYN